MPACLFPASNHAHPPLAPPLPISLAPSAKFKTAAGVRGGDLFVHCTMATDKQNVRYVFDACKEVITTFHLRDLGML